MEVASNPELCDRKHNQSISGLVAEYIVAIDVTRVRFPADAFISWGRFWFSLVIEELYILFKR